MKFSKRTEAIFAIVFATLLGATMGIWVRMMSTSFENLQQIALRAILGGAFGALLYSSKIKWGALKTVPKKDYLIIVIRSLVLLTGITLFTYAINNGNFANINFIYALPTTAILGVFLLKEKISFAKILVVLVGVLGVVLISVNDFNNLTAISLGEIAALVSTFLYSFSYLIRKWISPKLNNQEIASFGSLITGIAALLLSFAFGNDIANFQNITLEIGIVIVAAGLTYLGIGYFNNLGFEYLDAITANNLLTLNAVFSLVISIILCSEIPTFQDILGGTLVIASAILINYADKKLLPA